MTTVGRASHTKLALDDNRVADSSIGAAGLIAAMFLADLGADVVKPRSTVLAY